MKEEKRYSDVKRPFIKLNPAEDAEMDVFIADLYKKTGEKLKKNEFIKACISYIIKHKIDPRK